MRFYFPKTFDVHLFIEKKNGFLTNYLAGSVFCSTFAVKN